MVAEACEETARQWETTGTYEETVWREKDIPAKESCGSQAEFRSHSGAISSNPSKGDFIGSRTTCTTTPARTERYQTTETRQRTVRHLERTLRWRGVAMVRFPGGAVEVPFDVEGKGEGAGWTEPSPRSIDVEEVRRTAWRAATLAIHGEVMKGVVAASVEQAVEEGTAAAAAGRDAEADEAFARAVSITAYAPDAAYDWFDRRHGLDRQRLLALFDGTPWQASFHEPRPEPDFEPPATDCPQCLDTRKEPLDHDLPALTIGGLSYARTAAGRDDVVFGVDTRSSGGFGAGGGFELGYGHGGLLYGTSVRVGFGVATARLRAGVHAGAGLSGALWGDLPFSFELPAEVAAAYVLSPGVRLAATARAAWVTADEREGGAPSASFADELRATAGVQLGRLEYDISDRGQGFYLGLDLREQRGTRSVGITAGVLGL
jgi:hypothetical protein